MGREHAPWAFGKVAKGFEVLVVGEGELRDRLVGAWDNGLCAAFPEMMPTPELEERMRKIHAFFTQGSGRPDEDAFYREIVGIAAASVRRRRYSTLRPIADQIWDLYDGLRRELEK